MTSKFEKMEINNKYAALQIELLENLNNMSELIKSINFDQLEFQS